MTLNDRLTRGLLAGVAAGFPAIAWGLFSNRVLHFTKLSYADFASALTFGGRASYLTEHIFSQFIVFMFFGLGGIGFAYLIHYVTSKNIVLKGLLWGAVIWFLSYVVVFLYKVPQLDIIDVNTSISQLIEALLWGGLLAFSFDYLDKKVMS